MADYRETSKTVTTWRRIGAVHIDNPLVGGNAERRIRYSEEDVMRNPDLSVVVTKATELSAPFAPLAYSFPLINPNTGDPIGAQTATLNDIFIALYSLYRDMAARRDAGTLP